jgi:oligopeptide/dipeptide ABC transporter ATP-binding protein
MNQPKLLEVLSLQTDFATENSVIHAVDRISFWIRPGEILGLVGESGCGKTVTALSILGLLPSGGHIKAGQILFDGLDLVPLSDREMRSIRGNKIAMIFQEPMTSLNPLMKIGDQVGESLIVHKKMSRRDSRQEAIRLLKAVHLPEPESLLRRYPHQLSGGMRQRVMIAMALACHPALLIADEPTTAVDVTIQAQILELLQELRKEYNLSILLITHALGVVAEIADRVIVMYAGKIVEEAPVAELFTNACHPYTLGLLDSIPRLSTNGSKNERLKTIDGSVPDLLHLPAGCSFYERCKERMDVCTETFPEFFWLNPEHYVACHKFRKEPA